MPLRILHITPFITLEWQGAGCYAINSKNALCYIVPDITVILWVGEVLAWFLYLCNHFNHKNKILIYILTRLR